MSRYFRYLLPLMVAAIIGGSPVLSARATEYLSSIADLPLIDGLREQPEKATVFDAPMGRIATAYASGQLEADDIIDFYDETLPQLGWERVSSGTYRRDSETLKIDVLGGNDGAPANVSFTLSAESEQQ